MNTTCAYCHSPGADLLTPNGDPVCQRCDAHFRSQIAQHRAARTLDPIGASLTFASPRTLIVTGIALMAAGPGLAVVEILVIGRVHLILVGAVFCAGFVAFARGIR